MLTFQLATERLHRLAAALVGARLGGDNCTWSEQLRIVDSHSACDSLVLGFAEGGEQTRFSPGVFADGKEFFAGFESGGCEVPLVGEVAHHPLVTPFAVNPS